MRERRLCRTICCNLALELGFCLTTDFMIEVSVRYRIITFPYILFHNVSFWMANTGGLMPTFRSVAVAVILACTVIAVAHAAEPSQQSDWMHHARIAAHGLSL